METYGEDEYEANKGIYKDIAREVEKIVFRNSLVKTHKRVDGRELDEIRPIDIEVGVLPMAHGSALFTRGETQALVVATLGSKSDSQTLESIEGVSSKSFMLQYNFPPFSVGEVGRIGAPGRREIGHGALAERALSAVVPNDSSFPYTVRVVSDIKIKGLSKEILTKALSQAKEGRLFILNKYKEVLAEPRKELNPNAPRVFVMNINPDKTGALIGPQGKNIKAIVEATGASIDILDGGVVNIFGKNQQVIENAVNMIEATIAEAVVGKTYTATVKKVMEYGAFVEILPGLEGLLHVSQYAHERIPSIADYLKVGDKVDVMYMGKDRNGGAFKFFSCIFIFHIYFSINFILPILNSLPFKFILFDASKLFI